MFVEPYIEGVEVDASLKSKEIKKNLLNPHKSFISFLIFGIIKNFNDKNMILIVAIYPFIRILQAIL